MKRRARIALQVAVSGAVLAFLLVRLDPGRALDLIASSNAGYAVAALALLLATTWAMAWRWQLLLAGKGIAEPLSWLTKLYFVGYAASHVLPTSIGGDAVRIVEHARRRPHAKADAAAAVLAERVIGAVATALLLLFGLGFAAGHLHELGIGPLQLALVLGVVGVVIVTLLSKTAARQLQVRIFPLGRRLRLERPLDAVYSALHAYRAHPGVLGAVLAVSFGAQLLRTAAIWLCGEAVGVDVAPQVYIVFAALLGLVMIAPFAINGLGLREAFFVAFLTRYDVDADTALAAGLLFYALLLVEALPGAVILLWQAMAPGFARPRTL